VKTPCSRPLVFTLFLFLALSMFASDGARLVYVTPKGKAYHVETCRTLKKAKVVTAITIDDAKGRGLSACKVCKPGD